MRILPDICCEGFRDILLPVLLAAVCGGMRPAKVASIPGI
jgi:hypothetical protein